MLNGETKRKIKNARDILVGKIPVPTTQVEQITLALMYKFMSDMDEQAKKLGDKTGFFMDEFEKYSWKNITDTSLSAYDRVALYSEGLKKMNNNPNVPQLFRDIFKDAFLPFNDPETLKLFLDQINEIEYTHSEDLGDAYESLLSIMGSQGDAGQFRTPRHIIDFIVEIVDPKKEDRILDPACGTAGFLISAYKHILKQNTSKDSKILGDTLSPMDRRNLTKNFVGYDISPDMRRLSLVNMYLHQFPDPQVYEYDTLTSTDHWDEDFDCILANPPFMTPRGGIRPHKRFAIQANRSEVLFVDYIMEHLSTTGKAGVIVPEGIIFQSSNAYKNLRKLLVDDNYLWAVISLPQGVFNPYAGVKTSVLLLDKNIAKKTDNILFVNVENDGFDLGAQRKEIDKNDLPEILNSLKTYKDLILNGEEIKESELFNTNVVGKSMIKESADYNLSGNRYQSVDRKLYVEGKWGVVLLKDILENVKYTYKVKKSEYKPEGKYPVIDQSRNFIAGYCNNEEYLFKVDKPIVIFGDHTREIKYVDFDFVLGADGVKILKFKEKVIPKYMYYVLKYTPIKSLGYSRHFKELIRLEIPLPPIEEQKKIVEELDRYQRIIEGAKMVIDNWKPEIEIDPEWKTIKLKEACELIRGVTYSKADEIESGGSIVLRANNIDLGGNLNLSDLKYIKREPKETQKLRKGDILICMASGSKSHIGKVAFIEEDTNYYFGGFMGCIRTFEDVNSKYLFYMLNSPRFNNYLRDQISGVNINNLNQKTFYSFVIPLPPIEEQKKIVEELDRYQRIIEKNKELIVNTEAKIHSRVVALFE